MADFNHSNPAIPSRPCTHCLPKLQRGERVSMLVEIVQERSETPPGRGAANAAIPGNGGRSLHP